jgi:hypothetical protein
MRSATPSGGPIQMGTLISYSIPWLPVVDGRCGPIVPRTTQMPRSVRTSVAPHAVYRSPALFERPSEPFAPFRADEFDGSERGRADKFRDLSARSGAIVRGAATRLTGDVAQPGEPSIVGPSCRFGASKSFGQRQPSVRVDESFERAREGRPSLGRGLPRVVSGVQAVSSDSRPKGSLPRIRGPLHPASPPAPRRRAALLTDPETFERLAWRRRTYARNKGSAKS